MPTPQPGTDPTGSAAVARDGAPMVLLRAGLRAALPVAGVLVVGSFVLRGVDGGLTALVAAVVLLGVHVGTARAAAAAGRVSPQALQAVTLFGFLARLALYGVLVAVFNDVAGVDGPVLATVVVALTIAMLVAEARVAARYSKFWWQVEDPTDHRSIPGDDPVGVASHAALADASRKDEA